MKAGAAHLRDFGKDKVKNEFWGLIDRLQKCSEINYPNRLWSNDTYYSIAFEWLGKTEQLEERVKRLEQDLFKPCGEGENICNCKKESECGYK